MLPLRFQLRFGVLLCLWAVSIAPAAAQHRIPAIDPTGQCLFSGTTTLALHDLFHCHGFGRQDPQVTPAAAPLPPKPPCTPPVEAVPVMPVQPFVAVPAAPAAPAVPVMPVAPAACVPQPQRRAGPPLCPPPAAPPGPELVITPTRFVAPVNTEVVLAAGMKGPDGYFIMRQPIEWMLAQDGVGQIVAVGNESPKDIGLLIRHSPQKVATNYARAHTSTISQVLCRGTPTPADDVCLVKGQSWISVTSPTEGATHVVVWAPQEHNWERRKANATIYWVDAKWQFPAPVAARAGQRQTLTTVVTRSDGQPVSGWIVRYEYLEGPVAVFSARGETTIEIRTDASGRATAEVLPRSVEAGITAVRVQIIRPGSRSDQTQMVVGQGTTAVQWTTPGLAVRAIGTSAVTGDGAIGYRVEVTNSGDLHTRGVVLTYTPPPGVAFLNSTPAAQVFGQRIEWRLGDMPPRTTAVVELNCRATVTASIRSCFRATSNDQLTAEGCATTDVRSNALSVRMTGPETVAVGSEAKFLIDVTNVGPTTLTNITATDTFDPGLAHAGGERSPLTRTLAQLGPGQTDRFAVSFIVTQPGQQCHRLNVTADGGHSSATRACLTGTQQVSAPPQLTARVIGPPTRRVGELAEYQVEVRNTGSLPAANIVLSIAWPASLQLEQATGDREDDLARQTTRWRIAQLPGGQALVRQLVFRCASGDERGAVVRATVTSQQTSAISAQAATVITSAAGGSFGPGPAGPASPPASGQLQVSLTTLANPIVVGGTTTCVVTVVNAKNASDRDVTLTLQVAAEGLAISRVPGSPAPVLRSGADSVDFTAIREVRAGEQLAPYRVEVRGLKAGRYKLRATATSGGSPTGVIGEAELTVNAP